MSAVLEQLPKCHARRLVEKQHSATTIDKQKEVADPSPEVEVKVSQFDGRRLLW